MVIKKEVKIGAIVVVAVFLFIYGFNFLKGKNIFTSRTHYYVVYKNVGGLTESNPVYFNGFVIGKVNKIMFASDMRGDIVVDIILRENDLKIPKNTIARIFSDGLLGTKAIGLDFGDSKEYAQSGDTLLPNLENSITEQMSKELMPVKDKAESLIIRADSLINTITRIFSPNVNDNLRHSIENVNTITLNVNGLVSEQRARLNTITANIESISKNLKDNNENLSKVIANFKNISDSVAKVNLAQTLENANLAVKQTAEIMEKINSGKGSLGMLINNDSLYHHLNMASRDLDLLLVDLKEHPKRYVHLSVFGKSDKPDKSSKKKK
ncbi:MAG: MCE family protein [Bacteroidia bacterium]|nr:MCE family protein [Bacteroidia bacterium]MCZ2247846.1 MlaD family protein [Bacteroidia bacterium]